MLVQPKIEITNLLELIPNAHVLYLFQEIMLILTMLQLVF